MKFQVVFNGEKGVSHDEKGVVLKSPHLPFPEHKSDFGLDPLLKKTCRPTAFPWKLSVVAFSLRLLIFQEFITLVLRQTNGMHSPYFKAFFQNFNAEKFSISLLANSNKAVAHFKGMMAYL